MRKFFIGITNRDKWLNLEKGEKSFWCVYKRHSPKKGDLIALHRTGKGIIQLFMINDRSTLDVVIGESDCAFRGMETVKTTLLSTFLNPIPASILKSNPILKKSGPVGRNFQGTTFNLSYEQGIELLNLLKDYNKEYSELLSSLIIESEK